MVSTIGTQRISTTYFHNSYVPVVETTGYDWKSTIYFTPFHHSLFRDIANGFNHLDTTYLHNVFPKFIYPRVETTGYSWISAI